MGRSNPNARARPISTMQSSATTNRETVGGNTKAGIPSRVWHVGQYINGPGGGGALVRAPQYSGPFWPYAFDNGKVSTPYPLSLTNVLAGGVGAPRGGEFGPSADGLYGAPGKNNEPGFLQKWKYPIIRGQNRAWANRMVRGYPGVTNTFTNPSGVANTPSGLNIPTPGGLNGLLAPGNWDGAPVELYLPADRVPPNNYKPTGPNGLPFFGGKMY